MIRGHVFQNQVFSNDAFALFMNIMLNGKSGIVKGCQVSNTSNTVSVSEGYLWIKGRPIQIIGTETRNVDSDSSYCKFVIEVDLTKENTDTELNQVSIKIIKDVTNYPNLTQEELIDGGNVYQFPFAQFKTVNGNITEFKSLLENIDYESIYQMIQNKIDALVDGSEIITKCKLAPYPVGIIIAFDNETNPNITLGGEWEKVAKGEVLVGQDTDKFKNLATSVGAISKTTSSASGNTGSTILNINQIPNHGHSINDPGHSHLVGNHGNYDGVEGIGTGVVNGSWRVKTNAVKTGISVNNNGGNQGHTHTLNEHIHTVDVTQPSHIVIYWKRVK